jgi:hypothetical protein
MAPLVILSAGTLVAWGAWSFVLVGFSPFTGGYVAQILFHFSLGLALLGTLMTVGMIWHFRRRGMAASKAEVGIIARQAFLIVAFVIVVLNLASARLLRWWNVAPLALLTITLELFFMSLNTRRRKYASVNTIRQNVS